MEWLLKELDRNEEYIERSYRELKIRNKDEYEAWTHAIAWFRLKVRQAFGDVFENEEGY